MGQGPLGEGRGRGIIALPLCLHGMYLGLEIALVFMDHVFLSRVEDLDKCKMAFVLFGNRFIDILKQSNVRLGNEKLNLRNPF